MEVVLRTLAKTFSDQCWSIIHFHKYNNVTSNYLMIEMILKNKSVISYTQDLQVYVITYGVIRYHNDVSNVWNKIPRCHQFQWQDENGVVGLVSYQNSVSNKIHDADRNRFYNSITNWNKYYYNNEKTVKLRDLSHANTVMSDASHFRFLR